MALCIIVAAALARGLQSGDKGTRAGTLLPSSLASPAPTGRHSARQPHRSAAYGLWAGRGAGSLSLARTCPHSADGPQTLRATMTPAPFQSASRRSPSSPYVLKRRTAGLDMPHGGTPPTGHGPFGCPQPVWRAKSRLTISLITQQFAHSGCSSPTRSQARHKSRTACEFCVAIRIIALVRLVACDGHPDVAPSSMRSWSLLVKNRHFFRIRAVCVP